MDTEINKKIVGMERWLHYCKSFSLDGYLQARVDHFWPILWVLKSMFQNVFFTC
jgi:hypothetical protein